VGAIGNIHPDVQGTRSAGSDISIMQCMTVMDQ
jgi:hypothetical protein